MRLSKFIDIIKVDYLFFFYNMLLLYIHASTQLLSDTTHNSYDATSTRYSNNAALSDSSSIIRRRPSWDTTHDYNPYNNASSLLKIFFFFSFGSTLLFWTSVLISDHFYPHSFYSQFTQRYPVQCTSIMFLLDLFLAIQYEEYFFENTARELHDSDDDI